MSMNFIDAAGVLADSADVAYHDLLAREAKSIVQATVAAYDALAPDWSNAPENSQWCAIHANGLQYWFDVEPVTTDGYNGWHNRSAWNDFYRETELPLGIDWRLCKWHRPEVAA